MERTAAGKELALVRGPGVPGPYIPGDPRVQKLQAPNRPLGLSPQIRLLGTAWGVPTSGLWAPDPVKWLGSFSGESLNASTGEIIFRLRETGHWEVPKVAPHPSKDQRGGHPRRRGDFPEPGPGREDETGGPGLQSTGEVGSGPGTLPFAASSARLRVQAPLQDWGEETEDGAVYSVSLRRQHSQRSSPGAGPPGAQVRKG